MYHLVRSLYLYATAKEEYSILLLGLDNAGKTTLLNQIKALYPTTTTTSSDNEPHPDPKAGNTVPTVGQNVATVTLTHPSPMYLKIWDVGGQQSLRRLWTSYYGVCHAVVFVVDSTDLGDIDDVLDDQDTAMNGDYDNHGDHANGTNAPPRTPKSPLTPRYTTSLQHPSAHTGRLAECREALESILSHESMSGVPVLVLANKQDREDCVEVVRIKEGFVRKVFEGEKSESGRIEVRDSRVLPVSALRGTGVKEAVEWVGSRVGWNREGRPPVLR